MQKLLIAAIAIIAFWLILPDSFLIGIYCDNGAIQFEKEESDFSGNCAIIERI
jgi:hypothetical protein